MKCSRLKCGFQPLPCLQKSTAGDKSGFLCLQIAMQYKFSRPGSKGEMRNYDASVVTAAPLLCHPAFHTQFQRSTGKCRVLITDKKPPTHVVHQSVHMLHTDIYNTKHVIPVRQIILSVLFIIARMGPVYYKKM